MKGDKDTIEFEKPFSLEEFLKDIKPLEVYKDNKYYDYYPEDSSEFSQLLSTWHYGGLEDFLEEFENTCHWALAEYPEGAITICESNESANFINYGGLLKHSTNDEDVQTLYAEIDDLNLGFVKCFNFPVETEIEVTRGCRLLILEDSPSDNYKKGDFGTLKEINDTTLIIELESNNQLVALGRSKWERTIPHKDLGEPPILFHFKQFPVSLGYARSIQKSRDLSFEKIHIQLNANSNEQRISVMTFLEILSTCKSYDGITMGHDIFPCYFYDSFSRKGRYRSSSVSMLETLRDGLAKPIP